MIVTYPLFIKPINHIMKRSSIYNVIIGMSIALIACRPQSQEIQPEVASDDTPSRNNVTECMVATQDVTFTHALNNADKYAKVLDNGTLEFKCPEGLDFFIDPNEGKLTNTTLPALLTKVDNTKPFTLTAKVTPEFTPEGLYNAADLLVYANDSLWQKLCFEQDEYGMHRIVSVRTKGTSDDNNHDKLDVLSVFLKISSDTHTIASYYSIDNNEWHMVRLYENYYPDSLLVGVSSQCPKRGSCTSLIEDITLNVDNVKDFRMGK